MPDKLNIVETVNAAPHSSGLDLSRLVSSVVSTINHNNGDLDAVHAWMDQHPSSPLIPHLEEKLPKAK